MRKGQLMNKVMGDNWISQRLSHWPNLHLLKYTSLKNIYVIQIGTLNIIYWLWAIIGIN